MQRRAKTMAEDQVLARARLEAAIAARSLLLRAAGRPENGGASRVPAQRASGQRGSSQPETARVATGQSTTAQPASGQPGATQAGTAEPGTTTPGGTKPPGTKSGGTKSGGTKSGGTTPPGTKPGTKPGTTKPAGQPPRSGVRKPAARISPGPPLDAAGHPVETSARSRQNIVLGTGVAVMAIALLLTWLFYGSVAGGLRLPILLALTVAAIATPVRLARAGLLATSEWISPIALLLILLDGRELWAPVVRHTSMRGPTYAGLVMIVAALVAVAFQRATGLAVPRFVTILLLQPIPALLLYPAIHGATAWAAVVALVAALDILIARRTRPTRVHGQYLRPAVRALQQLVTFGALGIGAVAVLTGHGTWPEIYAGTTLITAALVALAGGLLFTRPRPLPHIGTGIAVLATIGGFGRLGGLALPGSGLVAAALATAACAAGIRVLPRYARLGGRIAGGVAALATAVAIVVRAWSVLVAPIRGAMPAWRANLDTYATVVADAARGTGTPSATVATISLLPAAVLLALAGGLLAPPSWRRASAMAGVALGGMLVPGAWQAGWGTAIFTGLAITLVLGVVALNSSGSAQSWAGIAAPFLIGGYTMGIAVARPVGQALFLGVLTLGAAGIAAWPSLWQPAEPPATAADGRTVEAAWGAAAFAMPGALAAACAIPTVDGAIVGEAVISAAFIAVAATLTAAAIAQVALRRPMHLLVGGAAAGAVVTAVVAVRTSELETADRYVAAVLVVGALMLLAGPVLNTGFRPLGVAGIKVESLDGEELAAAAVTCAAIVALTRVGTLVLPDETLALVAALVLIIALLVRSFPEKWRRGPAVGGGAVGAVVAVTSGYAAVNVAVTAAARNLPPWHATLAGWAADLDERTVSLAHGPQAPLALLLVAVAAWVGLGRRAAAVTIAIAGGLEALILPETLHTGWPGVLLLSGLAATAAGIAGAWSADPIVGFTRTGVAVLLFANTIAASLIRPGLTAATLAGAVTVCGAVAGVAVRTLDKLRAGPPPGGDVFPANHPILIGGGGLAGAVLALAAAPACTAAALGQGFDVVLTCAMGGVAIATAIIALCGQLIEPLLAYASGAISIGGLGIALAAANRFTVAGMFASVAALLAVLAEALRAAVGRSAAAAETGGSPAAVSRATSPEAGSAAADSAGAGSPAAASLAAPRFAPLAGRLPPRVEVLLAAGPAATLAIASVAATLLAALAGPYRWIQHAWDGPPHTLHDQLGALSGIIGTPAGIGTSFVLVVTAVVAAVGFGGSRRAVTQRAVAVITPGIAICLLIAPYLAEWAWPAGPAAAILVASICGLAVALTEEPAELVAGSLLRFARHSVVAICALATGAGVAGSLATKPTTEAALAVATGVGIVAALRGREQASRITGWVTAACSAQLLALVTTLIGGARAYDAAFVVGGIAAILLVAAARLPVLRRPENIAENVTVEVSAYAGAVLALALAARSIPHLAVFLAAWGAVLGVAAARPERAGLYRSTLMWTAAAHELVAWSLLMSFTRVALPEAYTLGVAVASLATGWVERRWHPSLTSWVTYGIALSAAFGPSVVILLATGGNVVRLVLVLVGSTAALIWGSVRSQQAPTVIGGLALLIATVDLVVRNFATVLVLILLAIIAAVLIGLGATFEKQRNNIQRAINALNKMQ